MQTDQNKKKLQKTIKYGALTVWAILIVIVIANRNKITVDMIINYTPSNLFLAAIVMLLLFALKTMSVFFYSGILYTASGLIFPLPAAVLVNALGLMVMISEGYLNGRFLGSDLVGTVSETYPKIIPILKLEYKRPFLFTLLLRMMKIINFDMGSMYMGATKADYIPYAGASFLTVVPELVLFAVVGKGISDLHAGNVIGAGIIYACITIASMLLIAWLVKHPEKYE
ncbi:MAG: VTT domain-containing protein [Clostridia bacterium]|nr:VTT domain-containing protein [Clostridia bacterium]